MVNGLLLISNYASFFHSLLELVTTEGKKDNTIQKIHFIR